MTLKKSWFATRFVLFFVTLIIPPSVTLLYAASGVIVSYNPQGAVQTYAFGINVNGTVVGYWVDSQQALHGYLRDLSTAITAVDDPDADARGTYPQALNDLGQVTGGYGCLNSSDALTQCGFVRDQYGNYTTILVSGAFATYGVGINNSGVIVGYYSPTSQFTNIGGFIRDAAGNMTSFTVPGATDTWAQALNSGSQIAGFYVDNTTHAFLRSPTGEIKTFDVNGAAETVAVAINNNGFVAGYYVDTNGVIHGYYRDALGNITTFDAPGAGTEQNQGTLAWAINAAGTIAGYYIDSNSVSHGFARDPSGSITTFDDPNASSEKNQGTFPTCINRMGQIAGHYSKQNGDLRGFVRK
jgi:hypothetical protein